MKFFEKSPVWTIEDNNIIGVDLAFTQGFRLAGIDPTVKTDDFLENISVQLANALSAMPEDSILRFYSLELSSYESWLKTYEQQFKDDAIGSYFAKERVQQFLETSAYKRDLFFFVSTPSEKVFLNRLGKKIHKIKQNAHALHQEKLASTHRMAECALRYLSNANVSLINLNDQALFETMWRMANPILSSRLNPPEYSKNHSLRCQLFTGGCSNDLDFFEREGVYNRILTLRLPPRIVNPLMILELQDLPFSYQLVLTLKRIPINESNKRVETIRTQGHEWNRILSKLRGANRNAELPDHAVLQQQNDSNDALRCLNNGEMLYDVALQIWISAKSLEQLQNRTDVILTQIRACGKAEGAIEELRGPTAFLSMLPGHHSLIGDRYHPMMASRAADTLPIFESHKGASRPLAALSTRRGEPVGFDPFNKELQAWNATVAGGTGSGKSFATRILLNGWLTTQGRVIVVTRGTDYHRYAALFGGVVRDIAADDLELSLNPLPPVSEVENNVQIFEHLASIIGVLCHDIEAKQARQRRRLIFKTTTNLYETHKGKPTLIDWINALQNSTEDLLLIKEITEQLRYWLDGPFGAALLRPYQQLNFRLGIWNLAHIRDQETQTVILALLSGVISGAIKQEPTIIVMDEVWSILASPAGSSLVETLYRTVRKEGSSIWSISQSMNDYALLPDSCRSAILNNSPIKIFLPHDSSEISHVTDIFQLNTRESLLLSKLKSLPGHFSEMLMFSGMQRQVLRLYPTPSEYWLCTSHPDDCRMERALRLEQPNLNAFDCIKLLARRYPHGAFNLAQKTA